MGFADYSFYDSEYYGDSVDESSFPKWESRAADKLQALCFGRINDNALREYGIAIKKAECALIDVMYQIDYKARHANDTEGGNIKSMSSGGQSISFGSNETLIDKVLGDKKAQDRLCYDTVAEYLAGTGLLYAGVM